MSRAVLFFIFAIFVSTAAQATTIVLIDSSGNIVTTVDFSGFSFQPSPGFTAAPQTSPPMVTGGTFINGVYTPPPATSPPPAPPPTSVQVNSTSTPALSGVYAFDPTTQAKLMAVSLYIQVNSKFPDGQTAFPWPDTSGTMHSFATTAQFQTFATAIADYATAIDLGQTPTAPVTIP
jgi:hypothetical protein